MACQFERRDACPACGTEGGTTLVDLSFAEPPLSDYLRKFYSDRIAPGGLTGGRYVLVDCASCRLIYQRDVPVGDLLTYVYNDAVHVDPAEGRSSRGLADRRGYAFQVEEMLKFFGRHPAEVEVLDYGMGWGSWLQMAQAYGCRASGAELSSTRADASPSGIEVVAHDSLPAGRYHFINTEQVFEHLVDPAETGARLVEALRPGGLLRVSVPNGSNVRELMAEPDWTAPKGTARSLNAVAPLEHLNCFSHESLVRFGSSLGVRLMHYPVRQFLEPWERIRFAVSAIVHAFRQPKGTMLLFRKP